MQAAQFLKSHTSTFPIASHRHSFLPDRPDLHHKTDFFGLHRLDRAELFVIRVATCQRVAVPKWPYTGMESCRSCSHSKHSLGSKEPSFLASPEDQLKHDQAHEREPEGCFVFPVMVHHQLLTTTRTKRLGENVLVRSACRDAGSGECQDFFRQGLQKKTCSAAADFLASVRESQSSFVEFETGWRRAVSFQMHFRWSDGQSDPRDEAAPEKSDC